MQTRLSEREIRMIVKALRYYAHNEAGMSQQPGLLLPDDFDEWDLAAQLEKSLATSRRRREGLNRS